MGKMERDLMLQSEMQDHGSHMSAVKELLSRNDTDKDGFLTWEEFQSFSKMPEVHEAFSKSKIDLTEAIGLFKLREADAVEAVGIDEYVVGLMLLKGEGSKDLITMWYENKQL